MDVVEATPVEAKKLDPLELDERGLYRMRDSADEVRVARMMLDTKAVPASFRTPQQVVMAIQALKSLGLNWRTAIRQCSFSANGAFTVFGDLELAVVRQSGQLESIKEFLVVEGDGGKLEERCFANGNIRKQAVGAVVQVKRVNQEVFETSFTIEDAKQAGLWEKTPTWRGYPQRMMVMRARSLALRSVFGDITQGLAGHEYDIEGIDYGKNNGAS